MEREDRTRLASVAVLFLVLATGFLLGLAWDRAAGVLEADEGVEEAMTAPAPAADVGDQGATGADRDGGDDRRAEDVPAEGRRRDDDRDRRLIVHGVGITPEQEARVDSIVEIHGDRVGELRRRMEDEYDPRFRQLRQEREAAYGPRFEAILMETRRSIRSVLSEEQAVRYDSLLAEHDRREAERKRDRH